MFLRALVYHFEVWGKDMLLVLSPSPVPICLVTATNPFSAWYASSVGYNLVKTKTSKSECLIENVMNQQSLITYSGAFDVCEV